MHNFPLTCADDEVSTLRVVSINTLFHISNHQRAARHSCFPIIARRGHSHSAHITLNDKWLHCEYFILSADIHMMMIGKIFSQCFSRYLYMFLLKIPLDILPNFTCGTSLDWCKFNWFKGIGV